MEEVKQTNPNQVDQAKPTIGVGNIANLDSTTKLPKSKLAIIIAVVSVLILLGLIVFFVKGSKKPPKTSTSQESGILVASPNAKISPPVLPKVKEASKSIELGAYFKRVSPANFKDTFLANLPDAAAEDYLKYIKTENPEEKINAARSFYIILNNPAADRSDPQFNKFVIDIRADLEKTLGKPLF